MTDPQTLPLRDIHLPDPVSWWPPAPGWYVLAGMAILVSATGAAWYWWRLRTAFKRAACRELEAIKQRYSSSEDVHQAMREVSVLIRRVALTLGPRERVAALLGQEWFEVLDSWSNAKVFTVELGPTLAVAPYQPAPNLDVTSVLARVEAWLRGLPNLRQPRRGQPR